ncbi:hypothetical protein ACLB1R_29895 [Escherichia coli]
MGYARFNPIYANRYCHARRTLATQRSYCFRHPLHPQTAECASQASYIHVREGRGAINFSRFNQAYMMHAPPPPRCMPSAHPTTWRCR